MNFVSQKIIWSLTQCVYKNCYLCILHLCNLPVKHFILHSNQRCIPDTVNYSPKCNFQMCTHCIYVRNYTVCNMAKIYILYRTGIFCCCLGQNKHVKIVHCVKQLGRYQIEGGHQNMDFKLRFHHKQYDRYQYVVGQQIGIQKAFLNCQVFHLKHFTLTGDIIVQYVMLHTVLYSIVLTVL